MAEKKDNTLEIMFPHKEVDLGGGQTITVKPISLEDITKVSAAFTKIMTMTQQGVEPIELAMKAFDELLQLLPYCIEVEPKKVPSTVLPDIIEAVIDLNVNSTIMGKWNALIRKFGEAVGIDIDDLDLKALSQGVTSSESSPNTLNS